MTDFQVGDEVLVIGGGWSFVGYYGTIVDVDDYGNVQTYIPGTDDTESQIWPMYPDELQKVI